jgi:hypothetical protein
VGQNRFPTIPIAVRESAGNRARQCDESSEQLRSPLLPSGRFSEAESRYLQALLVREKTRGADHPGDLPNQLYLLSFVRAAHLEGNSLII